MTAPRTQVAPFSFLLSRVGCHGQQVTVGIRPSAQVGISMRAGLGLSSTPNLRKDQ